MNKNILITGGTKGIGKNISSSLLENNFNVICLSRYAAKEINNKNFFFTTNVMSQSQKRFLKLYKKLKKNLAQSQAL